MAHSHHRTKACENTRTVAKRMEENIKEDTREDRIEGQYLLISGLFADLEKNIKTDINRSMFRYSCNAVYYGAKKIDLQLSILLKSNQDENYYVNNILFRTIFEHYLVAYFIATKCRIHFTDDTGREYYGAYGQKEYIKRVFKHYDIEALKDDRIKPTEQERIQRFNDEHQQILQPLTEKEKTYIYNTASQFGEDKIIKYLLHETPWDDFKNTNKSLYALLNTYNVVSSNIHGGPGAELELFKNEDIERVKRLNSIHISLCKFTSFSLKLSLFSIFIREKHITEYKHIFIPLEQLMIYYRVWP
jgi:hypothetical protein